MSRPCSSAELKLIIVNSQLQTAGVQQPATNSRRQTASYKQPLPNSQLQTTSAKHPATNSRPLTYLLPATHSRHQTASNYKFKHSKTLNCYQAARACRCQPTPSDASAPNPYFLAPRPELPVLLVAGSSETTKTRKRLTGALPPRLPVSSQSSLPTMKQAGDQLLNQTAPAKLPATTHRPAANNKLPMPNRQPVQHDQTADSSPPTNTVPSSHPLPCPVAATKTTARLG